jgi:hypothetical protein
MRSLLVSSNAVLAFWPDAISLFFLPRIHPYVNPSFPFPFLYIYYYYVSFLSFLIYKFYIFTYVFYTVSLHISD